MPTSLPPPSISERERLIRLFSPGWLAGLAAAWTLLFASIAWAGTSTLTALASVNTNCSVATSAVAFGTYDPITVNAPPASGGVDLNATGSITVTCVKGTAPTIGLDLGAHASGSTRQMLSGAANFLTYELYQPPNNAAGTACAFPGTTVWGTAGVNLFSPSAAPSKAARIYNICGTVAAGQNPAIGTYADAVVATVTF
jgi:spore coat protein U domain-containing protein, fimbrial subunit CupE1/2/3/6